MFRRLAPLLAALLFAMGGFAQGSDESDHHEHPGVTDAHPGDLSHRHGDADDHHESPDSPCHHHVIHCDCSAAPACPADSEVGHVPGSVLVIPPPADRLDVRPSAASIFHVPIA